MMVRPSNRVLEALQILDTHPAWAEVLGWIEESLTEVRKRNDIEPGDVRLRQGQGAAQTLTEITEIARNAQQALSRGKG